MSKYQDTKEAMITTYMFDTSPLNIICQLLAVPTIYFIDLMNQYVRKDAEQSLQRYRYL